MNGNLFTYGTTKEEGIYCITTWDRFSLGVLNGIDLYWPKLVCYGAVVISCKDNLVLHVYDVDEGKLLRLHTLRLALAAYITSQSSKTAGCWHPEKGYRYMNTETWECEDILDAAGVDDSFTHFGYQTDDDDGRIVSIYGNALKVYSGITTGDERQLIRQFAPRSTWS
jgi:hypothetical protein